MSNIFQPELNNFMMASHLSTNDISNESRAILIDPAISSGKTDTP
jgi:hypothetical protein